jgi:RNA-binding protein
VDPLTGAARTYLRGLAHGYKPAVIIGKAGLTAQVLAAIDEVLDARELVKIRIDDEREARRDATATIEERLGCTCVGAIGRMAVLFRQHSDPERRQITLPTRPLRSGRNEAPVR